METSKNVLKLGRPTKFLNVRTVFRQKSISANLVVAPELSLEGMCWSFFQLCWRKYVKLTVRGLDFLLERLACPARDKSSVKNIVQKSIDPSGGRENACCAVFSKIWSLTHSAKSVRKQTEQQSKLKTNYLWPTEMFMDKVRWMNVSVEEV